ncbi:MAG: hypothetical protein CBB79_11265 [Synechococcus sp. TMED19]|nr:MAG: hypothetical protein CBB79_11265 [Synechococcus sp. TMED19]
MTRNILIAAAALTGVIALMAAPRPAQGATDFPNPLNVNALADTLAPEAQPDHWWVNGPRLPDGMPNEAMTHAAPPR